MFVMKDEFRTGIGQIDEEHEKLFEIANLAYQTLTDDYIADKFDYIIEVLEELKTYAVNHFASEEAYMESINYKKLFSQKMQHEAFINKISSYDLSSIEDNQTEVIMEILEFLHQWLVHHILENDLLIGK